MIEIGRLCIKIAGRDGGRKCIIVDILDKNYVLIDGDVRRRKCNILHLEPTSQKIELKKGASHEEVAKEFEKLNIPVWETKRKEKAEKPKKKRAKEKAIELAAKEEKPRLFRRAKKKEKKKAESEEKPKEAEIKEEQKEKKKRTKKVKEEGK